LHTIKVLALGFVLLGAFVLIGRALGNGSRAALYFLPLWLAAAAINLWFGVAKAGYSVKDEAPIFLLIFAVPAAVALLAWWKLPAPYSRDGVGLAPPQGAVFLQVPKPTHDGFEWRLVPSECRFQNYLS
jgi:hypothetical protein